MIKDIPLATSVTMPNGSSDCETRVIVIYLEGQSACVFGDQEIGQVHKISKRWIEQEVPNKFDIFSGKF